ncbi:MAG: hypothetical protein K1X64_11035 [Myxococcaceae bacterium]|nr:hypothetical protein [Myxococcaceae bacterium]
MRSFFFAAACVTLAACTTVSFNVTRQALYPARKAGCDIEWVNVPASLLGPQNSEWELIGNISYGQVGEGGLDEALKKRVEAEICKMGGDAVSLGLSSQNQTFNGTGTATILMVLRSKVQTAPKPKAEQL